MHNQENIVTTLVEQIKSILSEARSKVKVAIDNELVQTYWKVGELIVTKGEKYHSDSAFIIELSKQLTKEIGKGYSRSNLFNMRNFYLVYPDVQTVSGHLSWSHYCELMQLTDKQARQFYEKEIQNSNWSVRELQRQISTSL